MYRVEGVDSVGGITVHVSGKGPAVLLLHGIGGGAASFVEQQGELAGFRTIAWEAPGYGSSADLPVPDATQDSADRYARAAVELLRGLGHERAHVLGVSWGGVIATRIALRYPELTRSLTLADSTRGSGRTEDGRAGMARRVAELAVEGSDAFARRRAPKLLAPDAPAALVERVVTTMARMRLAGYRGAAEMMAATDHTAELGRLRVPTLVLVGEHDRVTGVPESRALAEAIPDARFEVLPGGGHAVNQENPAAFNAALGRFLAEVEHRENRQDRPAGRAAV